MSSLDPLFDGAVLVQATITASGGASDICALPLIISIIRRGVVNVLRLESTGTVVATNAQATLTYVLPASLSSYFATSGIVSTFNNRSPNVVVRIGAQERLFGVVYIPGTTTLQLVNFTGGATFVVQNIIAVGDLTQQVTVPRTDILLRSI